MMLGKTDGRVISSVIAKITFAKIKARTFTGQSKRLDMSLPKQDTWMRRNDHSAPCLPVENIFKRGLFVRASLLATDELPSFE